MYERTINMLIVRRLEYAETFSYREHAATFCYENISLALIREKRLQSGTQDVR